MLKKFTAWSLVLLLCLCSACNTRSNPSSGEEAPEDESAQAAEAGPEQQVASEPPAEEQTNSEPQEEQAAQPAELDFAQLAPTTQMTYEELVGDNGVYEKPQNIPPAGTYSLEVDVSNNVVIAFDANGQIVRLMLCTTGKSGTRTPQGNYRVGDKQRFGYFDKFDCYAQYWTQIVDGVYFHSVLYNEKDADTLIRSSYRNLGRASSHGCVRLTVPDARWIYENCAEKTRIVIHKKPKDDALKARLKLPPIS